MVRPNFYAQATAVDDGLRTYMLKIYGYMTLALGLTGTVAYLTVLSPALLNTMYVMEDGAPVALRPLAWVAMLAPLGIAILLGMRLKSLSARAAQMVYWLYAALMGLSLSTIFLTFTGDSIALVLFIAAGTFGAVSLYGYTTQRDLTGLGGVLTMAVVGLVIAMAVNLFLHSGVLMFAVSIVGVLVFTGLVAADTQQLKSLYYGVDGADDARKKIAILGALTLYLDFVNLFLNLLNLLGDRRR